MTESIFLGVTSAALCVNLGWGLRRCGGGGENGSSLLGAASSGTHFMSFTCLEGRYRLRMEQMRNPRLGEGVSLTPGPSAGGVAGGWVLGSPPIAFLAVHGLSASSKPPLLTRLDTSFQRHLEEFLTRELQTRIMRGRRNLHHGLTICSLFFSPPSVTSTLLLTFFAAPASLIS